VSRNLRHILVIGVSSLLLGGPCRAAAQDSTPQKVTDIRVEGNTQMTDSAILSMLKVRTGANYDESIVKADEKRLLETGRFDSVHATRTYTPKGVVVTFIVAERPLVSKVIFKGNKAYSNTELAGELTFGASDPMNRFAVEAGRQALLSKYRSKGYHFATVDLDSKALADREVIYRIVEGPQVIVTKIRFKGNTHFNTLRLRQLVGASQRIWPFVPGHLDMEQIDQDVQTLRNLYMSEGYLDVQVGRLIEFSEDKTKATVIFVIAEGPRFRVNKVLFKGNTVFSDDELRGRLSLKRGEFFTAEDLRRDTGKLRDTYGELGYIEARVTSAKRFLDPTAEPPAWARHLDGGKPALLNVVFTIVESDQYRVGRIDIRGNSVTQGRIIRREMRIFPEQLFNMVAVGESRRRLLETRLFERVTITPVGGGPNTRNVLVEVAEGKTAEFLVGVGISTNVGLLGSVSFTQRNFDILRWPRGWGDLFRRGFKGAGQTLRIVAEPGTELMRFHIEWFEPYLFDQPYSLGTKAFLFTRGRESYDETRYGGIVSFGHRFKNRWYGELSSRIEGVEIDNLDSDSPPEVMDDAGTHALVGIKGTLVRDRTDSRWMPSAGDRFRMSYEQVTGGFNFGRATGDYRIYRTLYIDASDRKHILSGRLAGGQICGDAPVFERFYGGGIGSLRGFEYRGISPRSSGTDEPIGGDFMIYAGAEYGFPIIGRQVRGVIFIDTGTVEDGFEVTTYRASAGVGIRWIIPMFGPVPLSLDFGFPLNKDDDDETQLLSFTFGWTF